ncbi:MAG: hypothetical protein IJJ94_03535 [Bacteroidaceae bacterium]|nr:hypothetical protein [Bacteroidaceae bacterium]
MKGVKGVKEVKGVKGVKGVKEVKDETLACCFLSESPLLAKVSSLIQVSHVIFISRIRELENFSKLSATELSRIREKFLRRKNLLLILINSLSRGQFLKGQASKLERSNSLILDI